MGDISELRGLIVVIVFLSVFVSLVMTIPIPFDITGYEDKRTANVPEIFEGVDINAYSSIYNGTIDDGYDYTQQWDSGGISWTLQAQYYDRIFLKRNRYWVFGPIGIYQGSDMLTWMSEDGKDRGEVLTDTSLDADYNSEAGGNKYKCVIETDPKIYCNIYFNFNTTLYDSPSEAKDVGALYYLQTIGVEVQASTMNAWNVVGMLVFFQMPDIHPAINLMIAIPLFISIAYLIYVLVIKLIPFISGG